jgi:hypothetical protein
MAMDSYVSRTLQAEAILERVQGVQGILHGSSFRPIEFLGKEQFSPSQDQCLFCDDNPLG